MNLPQLFARRYLFSRKSRSVVNLIAGLSAVSVAMPVAAMIILLSVFNGFETLVKATASAFDPDLSVTPCEGTTFPAGELDSAAIVSAEGVAAGVFLLEQSALLRNGERQTVATVRGAGAGYAEVFPIDEATVAGGYPSADGEDPQIMLGRAMAGDLGIRAPGAAEVDLYALRRSGFSSLLPFGNYTRLRTRTEGIYALDLETEQRYALVPLAAARGLFNYPGRASSFAVRLAGGTDPERAKREVQRRAGDGFRVRTRAEMNASFYRIMTYEKWGIFTIALLVLVVAAFSIIGALVMLILEKRSDIAVLGALGADRRLLRAIFEGEGRLICLMGGLGGVVLGVGASLVQQHYGLIRLPAATFLVESYPVEFRWGDLAAVAIAFVAVTSLVTRLAVHGMINARQRYEI